MLLSFLISSRNVPNTFLQGRRARGSVKTTSAATTKDLAPAVNADADADDRAELERDEVDGPLSNSNHLLMIDRVALAQILSFAFIHVRIVFWVLVRPAETRGGARISSARCTPMSSSTVVIYYNILLLHLLQKKCSTQR